MSDETKAKAQEKLGTFIVKIGYPDKWKDYTALDIKNDSYWANICRTNVFSHNEMIEREGQPVDRTKWGMSPQTVNAYYNPTTNEICFPAAILNPPFFNPDADDAVNYGGIGVVIGHEMTHGFDDQGRNYDKDGNISGWWNAEDERKFNEMAQVLVDQYDKIVVNIGLNDAGNGKTWFEKNLAIFMDTVRQLQPNAKIILNGIMPVTKSYITGSKYGGDHWEPASLAKLNAILQSYANGVDTFYIDCNEYFADSKGYLYKEVTGDGCHPTAKHYKTWREWMNWAMYSLGI
jgi:lysophospholipase L1-like esterase